MKRITIKKVEYKSLGIFFATMWFVAYLVPLTIMQFSGKDGLVSIYSPVGSFSPASFLALASLLVVPMVGFCTGIVFAAVLNLALKFTRGVRLEIQEDTEA